MRLCKAVNFMVLLVPLMSYGSQALARKQSASSAEKVADPQPEMHIDPNLLESYVSEAATAAERIEKSGLQVLALEPTLEFHKFKSFYAQNDYFEIPLSGGSDSSIALSVWVGNPVGAVWFSRVRVRAGLELSYLGYDGSQMIHQRTLNMDFRDNISTHVFPVMASVRFGSASNMGSRVALSPWMSVSSGTMFTQVSGTLDGTSQSAWSPVTKLAGGIRYALTDKDSILGGVYLGAFGIAGSSKKADWNGRGVTTGADFLL